MLAAVGWIVAEEWHPLFGGQIGGAAFGHFQEIEEIFPQFWEIVVLVLGILETNRARVIYSGVNTTTANKMNPDCASSPRASAALFAFLTWHAAPELLPPFPDGRIPPVVNPADTPGELGFDPLGLFPEDAAAAAELQTKELNNGRLAMVSPGPRGDSVCGALCAGDGRRPLGRTDSFLLPRVAHCPSLPSSTGLHHRLHDAGGVPVHRH